MKIKGLLLIVVSLWFFCTDIIAQEKQKAYLFMPKSDNGKTVNMNGNAFVIDSLRRELLHCDSIICANLKLIDSLKRGAEQDSLRFNASLTNKRDSLLNVIYYKDLEISSLKANTGFVDTCMVKLANRWLYERFNKADVDEAVKYFDRIYSSKLKEEMSIVQELLYNYEKSYQDFQSILKEAQYDIDRESPFACDVFKDKYERKIENMQY